MEYSVKIIENMDMEMFELLATQINFTEGLLGQSKETLYGLAIDNIKIK